MRDAARCTVSHHPGTAVPTPSWMRIVPLGEETSTKGGTSIGPGHAETHPSSESTDGLSRSVIVYVPTIDASPASSDLRTLARSTHALDQESETPHRDSESLVLRAP